MTWQEFLNQKDKYIGGDIEAHEGQDVYRGPLKAITVEGPMVHFDCEWVAIMEISMGSSTWKKWGINRSSANMQLLRLSDIGDGRLAYGVMGDTTVLFPKGGSKLDPARVEGLTPTVTEQAGHRVATSPDPL